jgi:hypothetical protein
MLTKQGAQGTTEGADVDDSGANTPRSIHKEIKATKGETEKLDPSMAYINTVLDQANEVQDSRFIPRNTSNLGRQVLLKTMTCFALTFHQVFKVVWSEPKGETHPDVTDVTPYTVGRTKYGEKVHTTVRRFIIVAADRGHCQCLSVLHRPYPSIVLVLIPQPHLDVSTPGRCKEWHQS